jgi:hypothetical protein
MADDVKISGDGKVYEMLWDCKFCGTKKLLGKTHRFCPNRRPAPIRRYFPADRKVVVQDRVFVGADKSAPPASLSAASAEFAATVVRLRQSCCRKRQGERKTGEGQNSLLKSQSAQRPQANRPGNPNPADQQAVGDPGRAVGYRRDSFSLLTKQPLSPSTASVGSGKSESIAASYPRQNQLRQCASRRLQHQSQLKGRFTFRTRWTDLRTEQADQGDGTFVKSSSVRPNTSKSMTTGICVPTWSIPGRIRVAHLGDKTVAVSWPQENISTEARLGCEREANCSETYYRFSIQR